MNIVYSPITHKHIHTERLSRLKEEVVWIDTENSCTVELSDVKEVLVTPTSPVKEVKTDNDNSLTAGTFGFQGEVVKSQEAAMVCVYCNVYVQ